MNYPKYKENRMVEWVPWQCSVSCVMWILNYFRYTSFVGKDYYEVMQIIKKWKYRYNQDELLLEHEAWLRLSELWFDITVYFSVSKNKWIDFMNHPTIDKYKKFLASKYYKYIKWEHWVDPNDRFSVADWQRAKLTETTLEKELYQRFLDKKINIKRWADIFEIIKANQQEWTLFLTWLDSYTLYEKNQGDDEPSWWHIIIIKEIIWDDCIVYDPWPALWNWYKKDINIMRKAVEDFWEFVFIEIKQINA